MRYCHFTVNISFDLDIRTINGFIFIWRKIVFISFIFYELFSSKERLYLFIVFCIHGKFDLNILKYKRIFIFQRTIVFISQIICVLY